MAKLPFYHNFGHKSHETAINLAEKLVSLAPSPMSKVFFTNSGSEANHTVLKMLWYRSNALGQRAAIKQDRFSLEDTGTGRRALSVLENGFGYPLDAMSVERGHQIS